MMAGMDRIRGEGFGIPIIQSDPYPGIPTLADLIAQSEGREPLWPQVPAGWTYSGSSEMVSISWYGRSGGVSLRKSCRVYWGSHGCKLDGGHEEDCDCGCCECGEHHPYPDWPDEGVLCVAKAPYYGPETRFYGEDVAARGLPQVADAA